MARKGSASHSVPHGVLHARREIMQIEYVRRIELADVELAVWNQVEMLRSDVKKGVLTTQEAYQYLEGFLLALSIIGAVDSGFVTKVKCNWSRFKKEFTNV